MWKCDGTADCNSTSPQTSEDELNCGGMFKDTKLFFQIFVIINVKCSNTVMDMFIVAKDETAIMCIVLYRLCITPYDTLIVTK